MTDEISYIRRRVGIALGRRPVMPALALTYRLCEVGSRRLDPRRLYAALAILTEEGNGVRRTEQRLYASSDLSSQESAKRSAKTVRLLHTLDLTEDGAHRNPSAIAALASIGIRAKLDDAGWKTEKLNADEYNTFLVTRHGSSAPLLVTVTNEAEWSYPDAPKFWAHLRSARGLGAHPVIIARKVAPVTFALLSSLNGRALQHYELLLEHVTRTTSARDADKLGLPNVRAAADLSTHAIFAQLLKLIAERPKARWAPATALAFEDAMHRGFGDAQPSASELADWAERHAELSGRWAMTVRRSQLALEAAPSKTMNDIVKIDSSRNKEPAGYARTTVKSRVPFRI